MQRHVTLDSSPAANLSLIINNSL